MTLHLFLLVLALVLFFLGAWPPWNARLNLISAGLFCWLLAILIGGGSVLVR